MQGAQHRTLRAPGCTCSDNLDLTKQDIGGASIAAVTGAVFSRILLGAGELGCRLCRLTSWLLVAHLLQPPSALGSTPAALPCPSCLARALHARLQLPASLYGVRWRAPPAPPALTPACPSSAPPPPAVCDSYGPRYGHGVLQLLCSAATFGIAAVSNAAGFIACRM